ncbi:MAG: Tim44 domain-containing protein [Hydrogenophaga sp.]
MGMVWALMLGFGVLAALVLGAMRWRAGRAGVVPRAVQAPSALRSYSPKNVGNDASARPWESGTELPGGAVADVPQGFDLDDFLRMSEANFISLQQAWDRADVASVRTMMTDGMLEQIQGQLSEREQQSADTEGKTEVVLVQARWLGMEEQGDDQLANVEFSGLMREEGAGPSPFREIWSIARSRSGAGGWRVAGVQALQ